MTRRDDMVITPRLKSRTETGPRQRAREERTTERQTRRRRGRLSRLRRALLARRAIARRRVARPAAGGFRVGNAVRVAGRVLGAAAILAELAIAGGHAIRRTEHGHSGRLIDAQDADTIYGEMDERLTAIHNVRGFFTDPTLLRSIANKGAMSASLQKAASEIFRLEFRQAQGADQIERDPDFDSPESLVDIAVAKANEAGLKTFVHEFLEFMRTYMWFRGWFK